MNYFCVYEYDNSDFLGVAFSPNTPIQNPVPGVTCISYAEFPDDKVLQNQILDYLNTAFPGNGKNLFNVTLPKLEKLVALILGKSQGHASESSQGNQSSQGSQNQMNYMPISGYIVSQPTRNDDSLSARNSVSSFSVANHIATMPKISQTDDLTFGRPPTVNRQVDLSQYNFKTLERQQRFN